MKFLVACLVSSVLGGLFVVWLIDPASRHQASAQDQFPPADRTRGCRLLTSRRLPTAARAPAPAAEPLFNAEGLSPDEAIGVAVYDHVNKAVVNVTTKSTNTVMMLVDVSSEGSGSGSVLDKEGHILTNYHVVEDAQKIDVMLFDGNSYEGRPVGADPINDIAVIKIDAPRDALFPIRLGDSAEMKVGMRVFAIGNPFGLERTMTTGIISSLNRTLQVTSQPFDQVDHPDRRGGQPGQLGRPAVEFARPADRHEYGHRQPQRPERGRRLRDSQQPDRPRRPAADRARPRDPAGNRHPDGAR